MTFSVLQHALKVCFVSSAKHLLLIAAAMLDKKFPGAKKRVCTAKALAPRHELARKRHQQQEEMAKNLIAADRITRA